MARYLEIQSQFSTPRIVLQHRKMAFSPGGVGAKRRRQPDAMDDESPPQPARQAHLARQLNSRWSSGGGFEIDGPVPERSGMSDSEGGPPVSGPISRGDSASSIASAFGALGRPGPEAGLGTSLVFRGASPPAGFQSTIAGWLARGGLSLHVARSQVNSDSHAVVVLAIISATTASLVQRSCVLLSESLGEAQYSRFVRASAVENEGMPSPTLSPRLAFDDAGIAATAVSRACSRWQLGPSLVGSVVPMRYSTVAPLAAAVSVSGASPGAPPLVRANLELACDAVFCAVTGSDSGLSIASWLGRLAEFASEAAPLLDAMGREASGGRGASSSVVTSADVLAEERAFVDSLRSAHRLLRSLTTAVPAYRVQGDMRGAVSSTALCGIPVLHAAIVSIPWQDLCCALSLAAAALGAVARSRGSHGAPHSTCCWGGAGGSSAPPHCAAVTPMAASACAAAAEGLLAEASALSPAAVPLRARLAAALVILHRADNTLGLVAALGALVAPETDAAEALGNRVAGVASTAGGVASLVFAGAPAVFTGHGVLRLAPPPPRSAEGTAAAAAAAETRAMFCDRLNHFGRALTRLSDAGPACVEAFKPALDAATAAAKSAAYQQPTDLKGLERPATAVADSLAYASWASQGDDSHTAASATDLAMTGARHSGGAAGPRAASSESAFPPAAYALLRSAVGAAAAASRVFASEVTPLLAAARGVGGSYPPSPPASSKAREALPGFPLGPAGVGLSATVSLVASGSTEAPVSLSVAQAHAVVNALRAVVASVVAASAPRPLVSPATAAPVSFGERAAAVPRGSSVDAMLSESQQSLGEGDDMLFPPATALDGGAGAFGGSGLYPPSAGSAAPPSSPRLAAPSLASVAGICAEFESCWNTLVVGDVAASAGS